MVLGRLRDSTIELIVCLLHSRQCLETRITSYANCQGTGSTDEPALRISIFQAYAVGYLLRFTLPLQSRLTLCICTSILIPMTNKPILLDCYMFANRQATRFVSQIYERHLGKVGLTATQFSILGVLNSKPGMTMVDLAELLVMDRTSLVRALQPLTREKLVVSAPVQDSARRRTISLTKSGEQQFKLAIPEWEAAQAEYEGLVGVQASKDLRNKLHKVTRI